MTIHTTPATPDLEKLVEEARREARLHRLRIGAPCPHARDQHAITRPCRQCEGERHEDVEWWEKRISDLRACGARN